MRTNRDGDARLFPELQPNARGQISWTPSRFWRTYLIRVGIKNGGDGFGSHSFRHGLADQLRVAGYLDDEIEVALGHNQVTVTAGYGQVRQGTVARLSVMIEAVTFPGIDF
jgi:integrase